MVIMIDILKFEFSGQLILRLLQLLPVFDVFILGVLNLCLHRLQLGKELHEREKQTGHSKRMRLFIGIGKAFAL